MTAGIISWNCVKVKMEKETTKSSLKLWIENQYEENISVLRNKKIYRYTDLLLLLLLYY